MKIENKNTKEFIYHQVMHGIEKLYQNDVTTMMYDKSVIFYVDDKIEEDYIRYSLKQAGSPIKFEIIYL